MQRAEAAGEIATFELDLDEQRLDWSPAAALLFGFGDAEYALDGWEQKVLPDDLSKIKLAIVSAAETERFSVEFRVRES